MEAGGGEGGRRRRRERAGSGRRRRGRGDGRRRRRVRAAGVAAEGGADPSESTTRKLVVLYERDSVGSGLVEAPIAARKVWTISGSHWVPVPSLSMALASLTGSALR